MTDTSDDIRPVALGGRTDWVALARTVAKATPFALAALTAIYGFVSDRVQEAKNKAEAGYQYSDKSVKALEKRMLDLELATSRLVEVVGRPPPPAPTKKSKRVLLPPPPPTLLPVKVTFHPRQNPTSLDQAAAQIARPATPAPPAADASP